MSELVGCVGRSGKLNYAYKHGLRGHKLYHVWRDAKRRCYNKNNPGYKYYGARGISVCESWFSSFINFYNWAIEHGYKEGLVLDRINNDGNYEPNNCRFVTTAISSLNKRILKKKKSKYRGLVFYKHSFGAVITYNGAPIHVGTYKTEIEAALAYDQKAKELYGEYANLNFPNGLPTPETTIL